MNFDSPRGFVIWFAIFTFCVIIWGLAIFGLATLIGDLRG